MKIGYDAKRFFLNQTGLGNYSRWLVKNMAAHYPENEYFLYTPKVKPNSRLTFLTHFKNLVIVKPKINLITSLWRSKGIVNNLKSDKIGIYHGLSHELPIGIKQSGIKSVVTIHDLIFMRFPQYFGWISRNIYAVKIKYSCKVADVIIAISERTKADVVELLGVAPEKIHVIYQNCDSIFKKSCTAEQKQSALEKYNLPAKFILTVGTVEKRKNLLLLIKALPLCGDIKLVVVGKQTAYAEEVKSWVSKFQLNRQVIFLNDVAFADLPAIYQSARVFVYPSRYEGFGIPVLESLTSGTPVIAAKGSCLEEAGGPGSWYVDPDDENDLADKINTLWVDDDQIQKMIPQGKQYAAKFDDNKLAAQFMQLYNSVNYA